MLEEGEKLIVPEEVNEMDALDDGLVNADIEAMLVKDADMDTETDVLTDNVEENVSELEEEGHDVGMVVSELEME